MVGGQDASLTEDVSRAVAEHDRPAVAGRDAELAALDAFVSPAVASPAALLVIGEAGIGKTTIVRAGSSRWRPSS
jgi:Cdc6-like AAA superfamily ATPase